MARIAFDALSHRYVDVASGRVVPHVTQLLAEVGWDPQSRWYTAAGRERGTTVHQLTSDYDLGLIPDMAALVSPYRGWLDAYVGAMRVMRPAWVLVEEMLYSERYGFAGRLDRAGHIAGQRAILEIKTCPRPPAPARPIWSLADRDATSHQIQTALQAILLAERDRVAPEAIARYVVYVTEQGRYKVRLHDDVRDLHEAYRIVQTHTEREGLA